MGTLRKDDRRDHAARLRNDEDSTRFTFLFCRRLDADLDEEIRAHLAIDRQQRIEAGASPTDAAAAAQKDFGNVLLAKEVTRTMWGWIWLELWWQDLRYAGRGISRSPVFTLVSMLSLALGIGATATIFSVFEAVFFNAVTARELERVKLVEIDGPRVSYPLYNELSAGSSMLPGLAAYSQTSLSFRAGNNLERITGDIVSGNFFAVLGIVPALGRTFALDERRPEREPRVVVLSHSFWEERFGGDASILGQVIELDREPFEVVGVLSKDYRSVHGYGIAPEVYVPIGARVLGDLANPSEARLELIARLKDGVTVSQAQASISASVQEWRRHYPTENRHFERVQLYSLTGLEKMHKDGVPVELTLFFAFLLLVAGLVLVIACGNVAGLLLARGANRSREIAVRVALGATRHRLVRQMLTESFLLALLGAGAGIAIWVLASTLADKIRIRLSVPLELHLRLDVHLLAFTIAMALSATLLSGVAPALQASRSRWHLGSYQIGAERRQGMSLRRTLVIGQFALTFVLLVSAVLFLRSLATISRVNPGFDVKHLLIAEVNLDRTGYPQKRAEQYFETAIAEIGRLPGVRSVSGAAVVPLGIEHSVMSMKTDSHIIQRVHVNSVASNYFRTMGIPLLQGRDFQTSDRSETLPVAIVNENFARNYLNGHQIDSQVLVPTDWSRPISSAVHVVGVVADSKYGSLGESPMPALYWPYSQRYSPLVLLISTDEQPASALTAIRESISRLDHNAPVKLQLMQERLVGALLPSRVASALLGTIGSLGLVLAAIGIYGLMTYTVNQRTPEIGMRLALGATRAQILRMILRDALVLVFTGIALGLLMALLLTEPLTGVLSAGISVIDPFSFGVVLVVLSFIALIAAIIPAWRASCVDPIVALRYE